jgi:hypothetical protein
LSGSGGSRWLAAAPLVPRLAWPACPPEGSRLLICLSSPFVHAPAEMPIKCPCGCESMHRAHAALYIRMWRFRTAATGRGPPPRTTVVCGAVKNAGCIWHLAFAESWKMGIPFRSFTKFPLPTIADSYSSTKVQNSLPRPTVCSIHRTPSRNSRCPPCKPPEHPTETAPDCIRTCLRGESWFISLNPVAARAGKQSHNIIIEFG